MSEAVQLIEHFPVEVHLVGTPTEEDMARINALALRELSPEEVFVFAGVVSNDRLDAYHTRMDPATTLPNYEADLREGKPLVDSHAGSAGLEYVIGQSHWGELRTAGDTTSVVGRFYVIRDMEPRVVRGLEAGVYRRMSVGAANLDGRGQVICDICRVPLLSARCSHLPGFPAEDGRLATATIHNYRLVEASLVYHNATPATVVQKATRLAEQGDLPRAWAVQLEQWGVRGLVPAKQYVMPKEIVMEEQEILSRLAQGLAARQIELQADSLEQLLDAVARAVNERDALEAEVQRLRPLAEARKGELIERAAVAKVAVLGDACDGEGYRTRLQALSIEEIEREVAEWEALRERMYPAGRLVVDPEPTDGVEILEP